MRIAIIYKPRNPAPPEAVPVLIERLRGWVDQHASSFATLEFFPGGGGIGIIDVDSSSDLHTIVAANPFTPCSDVEIRPVLDPGTAFENLREAMAAAAG